MAQQNHRRRATHPQMGSTPVRLIMGRNTVREALRYASNRVIEIYAAPANDELSREIFAEIDKLKIVLRERTKEELTEMVESESHQSFVAVVKERSFLGLKPFLKAMEHKATAVVLVVDSVQDPQNLGTIMRAAECFGVNAVIWSKNRGVDITPVVSKAAVGATELLPLMRVSNLAETIKRFQEEGFWVVAAEAGEKSESLNSFKFPEKTVLIVGSEGNGIQPLLLKLADFRVQIPLAGHINSLNVSQATSVMLAKYAATYASSRLSSSELAACEESDNS